MVVNKNKGIRILCIEDSNDDFFLLKSHLKKMDNDHEILRTDNLLEYEKHLTEYNPDLVISDFDLVTFNGLDTLKLLRSKNKDIPFILVSGTVGEERAVQIMRSGANDYVLKDKLERLIPAINRELNEYANRKAKRKADEKLKIQNRKIARQNIILKENIEKISEINEELKEAKLKAEESDRLKSAFLANMSHEIRTPLNSIVGFSEIFDEPGLDSQTREYYGKIIKESSVHLLSIVNDVLDISKIETGQMNIKVGECKIYDLLNDLKNMLRIEANEKGIDLRLNANGHSDCIIHTDVQKLRQALTNIIQNAIKFTPSGYVEFGLMKKDNCRMFFVKDTGIGIPDDCKEKVFQRFVQIESSTTRNYGGTGLGLSITQKLVELLGGEIWFDSEVNVGSTFYFTLPLFLKNCE